MNSYCKTFWIAVLTLSLSQVNLAPRLQQLESFRKLHFLSPFSILIQIVCKGVLRQILKVTPSLWTHSTSWPSANPLDVWLIDWLIDIFRANIYDCRKKWHNVKSIFRSARTSWNTFVRPSVPRQKSKSPLKPYKSSQDHARPFIWNIAVKRTLSSIIQWWQRQRKSA